jgi:hypothetical protein
MPGRPSGKNPFHRDEAGWSFRNAYTSRAAPRGARLRACRTAPYRRGKDRQARARLNLTCGGPASAICCRALRGGLSPRFQHDLLRGARALVLREHDAPPSRAVRPRGVSLLRRGDEQRGSYVLGLSCGARQLSSTLGFSPSRFWTFRMTFVCICSNYRRADEIPGAARDALTRFAALT